jgi:hypothetical protein
VKRPLVLLPILLAGLASCGSDDAAPVDDDSDKRAVTIACLDDKGIEAREDGDDEVVINGDEQGPRIRFYLTAGEAEAAQFEGGEEGAEQIGQALLFVEPEVDPATEDLLGEIEGCLADL